MRAGIHITYSKHCTGDGTDTINRCQPGGDSPQLQIVATAVALVDQAPAHGRSNFLSCSPDSSPFCQTLQPPVFNEGATTVSGKSRVTYRRVS